MPYFNVPAVCDIIKMPYLQFIVDKKMGQNDIIFNDILPVDRKKAEPIMHAIYEDCNVDLDYARKRNIEQLQCVMNSKDITKPFILFDNSMKCKTGEDVFKLSPEFSTIDKKSIWNESKGDLNYPKLQLCCPKEPEKWVFNFFKDNNTPETRDQAISDLVKHYNDIILSIDFYPKWVIGNNQFNPLDVTTVDFYGRYMKNHF
jgi:hypothetical protein